MDGKTGVLWEIWKIDLRKEFLTVVIRAWKDAWRSDVVSSSSSSSSEDEETSESSFGSSTSSSSSDGEGEVGIGESAYWADCGDILV